MIIYSYCFCLIEAVLRKTCHSYQSGLFKEIKLDKNAILKENEVILLFWKATDIIVFKYLIITLKITKTLKKLNTEEKTCFKYVH